MFKLTKPQTLLIKPIEMPQSMIIFTKHKITNYAIVKYASNDVDQDIVGKTIVHIDGIIDNKFKFDHNIEGEILTEIQFADVIAIFK